MLICTTTEANCSTAGSTIWTDASLITLGSDVDHHNVLCRACQARNFTFDAMLRNISSRSLVVRRYLVVNYVLNPLES